MSAYQHYPVMAATSTPAAATHWVDGEMFANPAWLVQELLKQDPEALFFDAHQHEVMNPAPAPAVATGFPVDFSAEDLFMAMSGAEESADSSASSPLSSSSSMSPPEVPGFEAPTSDGSPIMGATIYATESKIEMAEAVPGPKAENASAVSHKRKNSTCSRKEADAKAVAPAPMSKRARANERNRKREAHNQAERERRDDLKEGYAGLRMVLPTNLCPDRKNQVELLQAAVKFITLLQSDYERIEKEKCELQAQLAVVTAGMPPTSV